MNENHDNQYIVYNLSEFKYDNSYFNNSVCHFITNLIGHGILFSWITMSSIGLNLYDLHIDSVLA
jgi:hypothetical protein